MSKSSASKWWTGLALAVAAAVAGAASGCGHGGGLHARTPRKPAAVVALPDSAGYEAAYHWENPPDLPMGEPFPVP